MLLFLLLMAVLQFILGLVFIVKPETLVKGGLEKSDPQRRKMAKLGIWMLSVGALMIALSGGMLIFLRISN
jgi:hypothetical protein